MGVQRTVFRLLLHLQDILDTESGNDIQFLMSKREAKHREKQWEKTSIVYRCEENSGGRFGEGGGGG